MSTADLDVTSTDLSSSGELPGTALEYDSCMKVKATVSFRCTLYATCYTHYLLEFVLQQ